MAVKWNKIAPYLEDCYQSQFRVERTAMMDKAYDAGADDDIVDTLDAIGSRIFNSVDDAKQYLASQGLIED